MISISLGT